MNTKLFLFLFVFLTFSNDYHSRNQYRGGKFTNKSRCHFFNSSMIWLSVYLIGRENRFNQNSALTPL